MKETAKRSHKGKRPAAIEFERQRYYFLIYEQMGTSRTLKRLHTLATAIGAKIGLKTLERYSYRYGWQSLILERAAKLEAADFPDVKAQVDRMNLEHVQVFQDIGALVTAGIKHWKGKIAKAADGGVGNLEIPMPDIARLAEVYQRGERLARGQATSKSELIIEVLSPVVKDFMAVFLAVNVITNDPPELVKKRQIEFITRGDAILQGYYGPGRQLTGGPGKEV